MHKNLSRISGKSGTSAQQKKHSQLPTPCSLLPPHSLLAHRLYYIKLEAQIAKTSLKTLYSCHIVIIDIRYKTQDIRHNGTKKINNCIF